MKKFMHQQFNNSKCLGSTNVMPTERLQDPKWGKKSTSIISNTDQNSKEQIETREPNVQPTKTNRDTGT